MAGKAGEANGNVNGNGKKHVTWRYVAGVSIGLVIALSGASFARHETAIDKLDEKKADKEIVARVEKQLERVESKIDDLINLHLEKNSKVSIDKKRGG